MTFYLVLGAAFVAVPLLWVMFKLAPWAAPLAGTFGLGTGIASTLIGFTRGIAWGFGLFGFAALMFVLGGGFKGR